MKNVVSSLMLVLTAAVPVTALAQTQHGSGLTGAFHGFAFGTLRASEGEDEAWNFEHLWLIGKVSYGEFELLTIIAPEGPPKDLHNLQLAWRPKAKWLDHIVIGKTQPRFGWEFRGFRRDTVPTVNYSGITSHMVARDWGVEVASHVGKVKLVGSVFLGRRTGGNIPRENGCCDFYFRGEYSPVENISVGLSFRGSAIPAVGADVVWRTERSLLAAELIRTETSGGEKFTEWVFLGTRKLVEGVRLVGRYENLRQARRTTVGLVVGLGEFVELKLEKGFVANNPDQSLSQLVFRW